MRAWGRRRVCAGGAGGAIMIRTECDGDSREKEWCSSRGAAAAFFPHTHRHRRRRRQTRHIQPQPDHEEARNEDEPDVCDLGGACGGASVQPCEQQPDEDPAPAGRRPAPDHEPERGGPR